MLKNVKLWVILGIVLVVITGAVFLVRAKIKGSGNVSILADSLSMIEGAIKFLPIKADTKKELEAIDSLSQAMIKTDGTERRYLIMLQNNMELRPGGGFLGQYAIIKIKDGNVTSFFMEDANILDQRITAKVTPPYPFQRMMSLKKWKFRDSNFSPDFPTNVDKAKYFYRLSGGNSDFDGVIAVNADVLNRVLEITGPITVPGYSGEFTSQDAVLKLEEAVEKKYIANEDLDTQNRKAIMKTFGSALLEKLLKINNIPKLATFSLEELRNKNIMLNFRDANLQEIVTNVHWDGKVATDWDGDYLMVVDANMGALKSDYYIKREMEYFVDLTAPKPTATLDIKYNHTATYGDWRTSDYHSYLRVYASQGSNLIDRKMVSYPNIQDEFGKTYFGFIVHVLINHQTDAHIVYELPDRFKNGSYKLLIQKQSGVGDVPIKIRVKNQNGEFTQEDVLKKDLRFEFNK